PGRRVGGCRSTRLRFCPLRRTPTAANLMLVVSGDRNWLAAGLSPMALTLSGMAPATGVSEQPGECTTQRHKVVRIPASFVCASRSAARRADARHAAGLSKWFVNLLSRHVLKSDRDQ